ncbi:MAG TPA: peptidase M20, partial [Tissierellia bacterium]|nr:peptidase M20 [Tissierellia bacterium]
RLHELQQKLLADPTVDERAHALHMVELLHSLWSDQDPVVIVYWSPPYYPHIYVKDETDKEKNLLRAVEEASQATESRYTIQMRKFYPYISDLSYGAAPREPGAIESLRENMPGFGVSYQLPLEEMRQLDLPVVNIGPFGKGAHKFTERVQIDYSYHVAPKLVYRVIQNLLR